MSTLGEQAHAVTETSAFETVARVGYAVRGVVNVLLGVLVVRVALGASASEAEQTEALEQVASAPFGRVVLALGALALAALGVERLTESVWGTRALRGRARLLRGLRTGAKGVVYLGLAGLALSVAVDDLDDADTDEGGTSDAAAAVLGSWPGRALVVLVGLVVLGVGVYLVAKGVRRRFLGDLAGGTTGDLGRVVVVIGTVGYVAKGVAYGIVGCLAVAAGLHADPAEAGGTAAAVALLDSAPGGAGLLVVVGGGFIAYGLYCGVRARHAVM